MKHLPLWQTQHWKKFQEALGRTVFEIQITNIASNVLVIKHELPFGKCWLEIPRGPDIQTFKHSNIVSDEALAKVDQTFFEKLRILGKKENAIFCRMSPPHFEIPKVKGHTIVESNYCNHPQTTLTLDLTLSEEDLLQQMKPKGRYNIKVAQKKGVKVHISHDVSSYYKLVEQTTVRDGFSGHNQKYYETMLKSFGNNAQLLLAEFQGEIIAGGIFIYEGDTAIYYYGASSNAHRNVMAPYLVQWTAIQEAKKRGCSVYDFLGIAEEGVKNHALSGVTSFKKKFGGNVVTYPQAKDVVFQQIWYWLYLVRKKWVTVNI